MRKKIYSIISKTEIFTPAKLIKTIIAPTCKTDGEGIFACECGNVPEERKTIPASPDYHDWILNDASTETYKIYVCSICNESKVELPEGVSHIHDYQEIENAKIDSTCTTLGSKTFECIAEGCNEEERFKTEVIPMKDHAAPSVEYGAGFVITKATKCGADGEEIVKCDTCGKEFKRAIPGHNYDDGIVVEKATCTTKGIRKLTCKDCNSTKTEEIEVDNM